jgi:hypothetical protein
MQLSLVMVISSLQRGEQAGGGREAEAVHAPVRLRADPLAYRSVAFLNDPADAKVM